LAGSGEVDFSFDKQPVIHPQRASRGNSGGGERENQEGRTTVRATMTFRCGFEWTNGGEWCPNRGMGKTGGVSQIQKERRWVSLELD
jgi:hypothetical protein